MLRQGHPSQSRQRSTSRASLAAATLAGPAESEELIAAVQGLTLCRTAEEIQWVASRAARRLTGSDGACFVLRRGDDACYTDEDSAAPLWKGQRFFMHTCIGGWVMRNRRAVAVEDVYADSRISPARYRATFVRSMAMVPIRQLNPMGAIGTYWAEPHRATRQELALLQALADSTAVALESVRARQELEVARREVLDRLALAAEYRDNGTGLHTVRVARIACTLAHTLGLSAVETSLIEQAAPLHDVGKLAIPEAILLKPGKLNEAEFGLVKEHTTAGAAILAGSASRVLRRAEEIALTHHERWDGSGYPFGLRADSIPMSGRIVALADVFDALTHARPYKSAWPVGAALVEIRRLRERQFDPAVVDAFLSLPAEQMLTPADST